MNPALEKLLETWPPFSEQRAALASRIDFLRGRTNQAFLRAERLWIQCDTVELTLHAKRCAVLLTLANEILDEAQKEVSL